VFFYGTLTSLKGPTLHIHLNASNSQSGQGVLMQNPENIPSRLWVKVWKLVKGCSSKVVEFQHSHRTTPGTALGWSLHVVLCCPRSVPGTCSRTLLRCALWNKKVRWCVTKADFKARVKTS